MVCSVGEVEFQTRNQRPLLDQDFHIIWPKLKGAEHQADDKKKAFAAEFYMDEIQYAHRFANAFRCVMWRETICILTLAAFVG